MTTPKFAFSNQSFPSPSQPSSNTKNQEIQSPFEDESCTYASMSDLFDRWCEKYGKTYASEEEKLHRLEVFKGSYKIVVEHNTRGNSSYTLGLNQFADLTTEEFSARYCGGYKPCLNKGFEPSINEKVIRSKSAEF